MIAVPWVLGAWSVKLAWQRHSLLAVIVAFAAGATIVPCLVADLLQRRFS